MSPKTTNDLPLTPNEMTTILVKQTGRPCALREEGTDSVPCPHCEELRHHPDAHGHCRPECADNHTGVCVSIGSRSFNPGHGHDIYEHKKIVTNNNDVHYKIRPLDD